MKTEREVLYRVQFHAPSTHERGEWEFWAQYPLLIAARRESLRAARSFPTSKFRILRHTQTVTHKWKVVR